ncbi:MAG: hypothetical protein JNM17_20925 [Archangium sp.]|nr:hypothetical protein [Archangium sp.]
MIDAAAVASGPVCYKNWRAHQEGAPCSGGFEVPLYSDCHIAGEIPDGLGPYALINALPAGRLDPSLVLRASSFLNAYALPQMTKTDKTSFTGASLSDEIACLVALALGARIMAGSATRLEIEKGKWVILGDRDRPTLISPQIRRAAIVPRAGATKTLQRTPLDSLPRLSAENATAVTRAARCYRDALWLAESEPDTAWLLLVSALEVASVRLKAESLKPLEIFEISKPELAAKLRLVGSEVLEEVANALSRELRATGRFLEFMERFLPNPPTERPPPAFQLDWSWKSMRKSLSAIYNYRSEALHEGIPFPPPMSEPPFPIGNDAQVPAETLIGLAAAQQGGVWTKKDLPMTLHTFEYIVRGALLKWWHELADTASDTRNPSQP